MLLPRDELVSAISHDLKSPLSSAVLCIDTAAAYCDQLERNPVCELLAGKLRHAQAQLERLGDHIDDLVRVARIPAVGIDMLPEIELTSTLRSLAQRYEPSLRDFGVRLELVLDTPVRGRWEPTLIERLTTNLLVGVALHSRGAIRLSLLLHGERARMVAVEPSESVAEVDFESNAPSAIGDLRREFGLAIYLAERFTTALGGVFSISLPGQPLRVTAEIPANPF